MKQLSFRACGVSVLFLAFGAAGAGCTKTTPTGDDSSVSSGGAGTGGYLPEGSGGASASATGGRAAGGVGGRAEGGFGGEPAGGVGGGVLDTSPEAGPCGQIVYDLEVLCSGDECVVETLPSCADLSLVPEFLVPEPTLRTGCGFVEIMTPIGEGDATTKIYDEQTQTLVYYGTRGATAIGCHPPGTRYGEKPVCDEWVDACSEMGEGGSSGAL